MIKILSFNVNSIRKRIGIVKDICQTYNPDIICLQETKIKDSIFPVDEFKEIGFDQFYVKSGENTGHYGVAIIAKPSIIVSDHNIVKLLDGDDGRHMSINIKINNKSISLHNFYVPSGGSGEDEKKLDNEKFLYKLEYLRKMIDFFQKHKLENKSIILVGDLNIAPLANDVYNHKQLLSVISHTPAETDLFAKLMNIAGLQDAARKFTAIDEKLFSWWSYRSRNWQESNRGRRLDHALVTDDIYNIVEKCEILKGVRALESPSDHCPVLLSLNI